jgi:hypothetical protein
VRFPDDLERTKENALWYGRLTPEERFSDFVSLLMLMDEAVSQDPRLRARQEAWIERQKDDLQARIRSLSGPQHGRPGA